MVAVLVNQLMNYRCWGGGGMEILQDYAHPDIPSSRYSERGELNCEGYTFDLLTLFYDGKGIEDCSD